MKIVDALKAHSPEILLGVQIATTVATVAVTVKATVKAVDICKDAADKIEKTEKAYELGQAGEVDYTEEDRENDLKIIKTQKYVNIGRAYIPTVLLVGLNILSACSSHKILYKRLSAAVGAATLFREAYRTVESDFSTFKKRVEDKVGEDIYHELIMGETTKKTVKTEIIDPTTGEITVVKNKMHSVNPDNVVGVYCDTFDSRSGEFANDKFVDENTLIRAEQIFNDRLKTNGYVFWNDILEHLGMEKTAPGQVAGWTWDPESDENEEIRLRWWTEVEEDEYGKHSIVFILDPNVQGNILDFLY